MSTRSRLLTRLAHRLEGGRLLGGLGAASLLACTSACTSGGTSDSTSASSGAGSETNRETRPADFTNGGFESGDFTGWTVTTMINPGVATFPPAQFSDLGLTAGGVNDTSVVSATTAGYPVPTGLTAADSLKFPYTNNDSAVLNSQGITKNTNVIEQSTTVLATDVDPSDGLVHARFAVAPVLQDPAHNGNQQPYFYIELLNTTTGASLFHTFNFSNQPGVSWIASTGSAAILYTNWKAFDIAPGTGGIRIGDVIHARVVAAGCSLGGHWGEVYLDQFGTTFPRPDVIVSAPAYANAGGTLTYTVTAKNGGNGPATGTVVDFTLPTVADSSNANNTAAPNTAATTFASITTNGQTCTSPAVGASGTVTCTIGALSPGGSSTFTVTVNLPTALAIATWTAPVNVNEGIYDIKTTQNPTPLTGGVVQTQITANTPVDLKASLTDGVPALTWGSNDTYTYTVTNKSAVAVAAGTKVTDTAPTGFAVSGWTCTATASSSCGLVTAGTTGAINATTGVIAAGGVLTYTINGKWTGTGTSDATYTVTATPPLGYQQSVTFDNIGSDTDRLTSTLFALTATKTGTGDGVVTSSPAAISCGVGTCTSQTASFGSGETVALWAIAPTGQTFTGWSGGGCSGSANPCTVVLNAATTVTAQFDAPSLVAAVTATSNGTSLTDVRPGDTEDSTVTVTVPNGQNADVVLADTLPAGLTYVSATAPTVTGTILCNGGACTAPTTATSGQTTTWDFGVVTCATVGGCTLQETVRGQTATTGASSVRGTVLTSTFAASGAKSTATTAVTMDEPQPTLSEAASPATGVTRGQTTTVTATITNSGVANSPDYDAVASFPTPANTTPQNYQAGTCPAATPSYTGANATFTFPPTSFPVGTSCTFSYDLLLGAAAPVGQSIAIPGGTLTSASRLTAPSKPYSVTAAATSVLTSLLGPGMMCASNTDCSDGVCDTDGKCGYIPGDGPCTPGTDPVCRSTMCSASKKCEPAGGCLVDGDCTATQFCNTVTDTCTPKLLNGTPIPMIAGHVPALTGLCTTSNLVGQAVCDTGICDTDNKCGINLGDGTCTTDAECRAGVCVTSGTNAGKCEVCRDDSECASNATTKACDTTTNQCVTCTGTNATACSGSTAFCNAATDTCTGCTGDNGSTATYACPAGAPYCDPDPQNGGSCTTTCYADSDCGSGNWCDAGACTPKLPNGSPLPKVPGHTPTLDGTCTVEAANSVCITDSCDPTLLICGFANGEGPCTDSAQCGNGVCITSGANAGKCEPCFDDTTCGGSTPVCNTVTNFCAGCGPNNFSECGGVTPICNSEAFLCVACTGDFGSNTPFSCLQENPNCTLETGACGITCTTDSECGTGLWCDANACTAKLPNGTPIPFVNGHVPTLDGICSSGIAQFLCLSGICDAKTNICGISLGDACTTDDQCSGGNVCTGGFCAVGTRTGGTDGGAGGTGGNGADGGIETSGGPTGTTYDVLGGGCMVDPTGGSDGGAELGALFTLVGLVTRRRRKAGKSAAASTSAASSKEAV